MGLFKKLKGAVLDLNHQSWRFSGGLLDGLLGTNFVGNYDAQKNFDLQKSNLNYQYGLQQQIFGREDTSVARRAADLQAAGINPLMAAGSAASSGAVVSTSAPQRETPKWSITDKIATILSFDKLKADIGKTLADTAVAGATRDNLAAQNANIEVQNDLIKAQTIKAIADATGWSTEEVALKIFGFGYSNTKKKPNKDIKTLHFSDDPKKDDMYHDYLRRYTSGSIVSPV